MYGLTRATVTLIAAGISGLLIWFATQIGTSTNGDYWAAYGVIAAAGLVMALSQLLGGWTKWGWPRISITVFLWAFIPAAIVVLWIVVFHQPHHGLGRNHFRKWSNDIGIDGFVRDFKDYVGVLSFGLGLLLGYAFDTTGPIVHRKRNKAPAGPTVAERTAPEPPRDAPPSDGPPRE
jgi:drug/metabolite transporter superfamily protein YnfA